jgi:DnaJ-class molecular chaperone
MENNNLYDILDLKNNASKDEIKKQFKTLALKYHPDKNKEKNANEKFNQIRIAYEILSDPNKKIKYDNMIDSKKKHFTDTIFLFIKEITNPKTIHNMMCRPDIIQDIKDGNINKIAQKMIQKILDNIDLDIDITKLTEIFIHSPSNISETTNNQNNQSKKSLLSYSEKISNNSKSNINYSDQIEYSTSDYNTLNIFGNIKTNLDDIYHNRLKEIIITRKVYENNKYYNETTQYYIPLYDPRVTILHAGDKSINNCKINIGDVILKVYCKKDSSKKIIRDNYDIIYNDEITLYELFNGFNKNISYFGSEINICSETPFQEYKFDGNKIIIIINNKGLPYDQDNNRGDLKINLHLIKDDDFDIKLEKYFNK